MYSSILLHGEKVSDNNIRKIGAKGYISIPGCFNGENAKIELTADDLSKHTLLIGATGCGKTNVFYHYIMQIKSKLASNDVMIIFDTKGDFVKRFYTSGDYIIGNSKQYSDKSAVWNIYKEIVADGWNEENIEQNTREIVHSIFKDAIEKNNSQPFFPNAATDLLVAIIIAHLRFLKGDKAAMNSFLNNRALKRYLDNLSVKKIEALLANEDDLKAVLTYLGDGQSDQSMGVISELQSVVRQIFVGIFREAGDFSISNFVKRKGGKTLFVEYDLAQGETLTPIYRLLFDLALKEAMGRTKAEGNVYFVCDEFKLLPNLAHIEDGVNFGRSLGVKVLVGLQSIEQLYEIYGTSKGKNIAAGFSNIIAFKANDPSTRDYIRGLYGENIVLEQYTGLANTIVEEKRSGKAIEDWDMTSLDIGEAIVGLPFASPFTFKFDLFRG